MSQDLDQTVSQDTHFVRKPSLSPLERASIAVKDHPDGSRSTGGHRPNSAPAQRDIPQENLSLENYVHPNEKYILVEEPDKRFRLVGVASEGKIKLRGQAEEQSGDDNRVRITATSVWPHAVHGHCIITYPDGNKYIGSGTVVNKHHVITAGHVVYSKNNGGWATTIQFNAGQNDGTLPFGSAFATRLFSFKGWTDGGSRDFDTGMLILDRDLGNQTGWMGLIKTADGNLMNHQVTVEGYPGDKGGQQLWAATGPINGVSERQITYLDYTKGGDSGAGVYGVWPGVNMEHVCGDHVAGPNGLPNTGSRLSSDKFDRIVSEWFAA